MKRIITLILITLLIATPVFAGTVIYKLVEAKYPIMVNGEYFASNLPILNYNGNTYVPLKAVLDMTGAKTQWTGSAVDIQTAKQSSIDDVAKNKKDCVMIKVYKNGTYISQGSGVILSDGHIITNKHVVKDGDRYEVIYDDATTSKAERVTITTDLDIAILKPEVQKESDIVIGDSDTVKAGDEVIAISSPKEIQNLVTYGEVKTVTYNYVNILSDKTFTEIQISTMTNKGSSGGGLFNMNGELIGIVYASGLANTDGRYVIAINDIKPILEQLK